MSVLNTIILEGTEAEAERQRLLADGKELSLVCSRRDSKGKDVSKILHFGLSGEGAWVAVQDFKNSTDIDIDIEIGFPAHAQELFAVYIERVMTAKMLTNSDPRSPEWFDLEPGIDTFTADLKAEFDVVVDPWA